MKIECKPQLILTKNEFDTLDNALKLCRDMDEVTEFHHDQENDKDIEGCENCPFKSNCSTIYEDCAYAVAHRALKKIIDVAIVQ